MSSQNPTRQRRIRRPRAHTSYCSCDGCIAFLRLRMARAARDYLATPAGQQETDQDACIARAVFRLYGAQLELFESNSQEAGPH